MSTIFVYIFYVILKIHGDYSLCTRINWRAFLTRANCVLSGVRNIPLHAKYILFRFQLALQWLNYLFSGLSLKRPGLYRRSIHVMSVEDKVARRQVFLCVLQLFPISKMETILRTHLHLRVVVNWRTNRWEKGSCQKQRSFGDSGAFDRKLLSSSKSWTSALCSSHLNTISYLWLIQFLIESMDIYIYIYIYIYIHTYIRVYTYVFFNSITQNN